MFNIPINIRRVAVITGIFILVFLVLEFNRRVEELNMLNEQKELLSTQVTQATQTQEALNAELAYANSTAAVDEWARTDGHYIKDGDLPMVPVGQPGEIPVEMNTPATSPVSTQNWEVWWQLFFGE